MTDKIATALITILPPLASAFFGYSIASKKVKIDVIKLINDSNEKLRKELKKELEECRTERQKIRDELNEYKKENDDIKKELQLQKEENKKLKFDIKELETKFNTAKNLVPRSVRNKIYRKRLDKIGY